MSIDMRGRRGRPWRTAQAEVYATETHCWLCGRWVDQELPWRHPLSRSVDHVVPLSEGGHPTARWNLRLAHRRCNVRRGAGRHRCPQLGRTSRQW